MDMTERNTNATSKRTIAKKEAFPELIRDLKQDPKTQEMKQFIQHGTINTYDHCMDVAKCSYQLGALLHLPVHEQELVRSAFLHDYYLYDWHHHEGRWHGYRHPKEAVQKADRDFELSDLERNVIESHMWPLTLRTLPHSREAVLVCIADKICSARETLFCRKKSGTDHEQNKQ